MTAWLTANLSTLLIAAGLLLVIAAVIWVLVRDKKKGKSPCCGGHCASCPMGDSCHKH